MLTLENLEKSSSSWNIFFGDEEVKKITSRIIKVLNERKIFLVNYGVNIWPSENHIFEMFGIIPPTEIKKIIIFSHPYNFNSGTGIPVLINNDIKPTPSLNNVLKVFKQAKTNDFSTIWDSKIFFINSTLTEEENSTIKIPHTVLWSLFFEKFLQFMSNKNGIDFIFTGLNGSNYKTFINLNNKLNNIIEIPSVTSKDFQKKLREALKNNP
jgi:uracil DNA glycosylase